MEPAAPATVPPEVLAAYPELAGRPARPLGRGLINDTFLVGGAAGPVVMQRLHPIFAPTVNDDLAAVTAHLAEKGLRTPRLCPTGDGGRWVLDAGGRSWRALTFVDGVTVERVDSAARAEQAGLLVGRFHGALADLDYAYHHVRAGVHDTPRHLAALADAVAGGHGHRLYDQVAPLADALLAAGAALPDFAPLPQRHAHGDLKISNLLFTEGGEGLCLVDLDTLGRMAWPLEMGDALRSWCNPAGEDVAAGELDEERFAAAVRGYGRAPGPPLTTLERDLLVDGLRTICVELAARFAADALLERYFGWDRTRFPARGEHNLLRAQGQLALARGVAAKERALRRTVAATLGDD